MQICFFVHKNQLLFTYCYHNVLRYYYICPRCFKNSRNIKVAKMTINPVDQ